MPYRIIELDARGLEPPEPMVRILESLSALPQETALIARTDLRPLLLYPQLEKRGFAYETHEAGDGSFVTHVTRR